MAIVYINVEYAKTRDEEKVSSSENDTTTKNTTKVSDEEMIINMIQDNPQITGDGGADIFLDYLSDQSKSMSVLYRTQIS